MNTYTIFQRHFARITAATVLMAGLLLPVDGESAELKELLSGKTCPLIIETGKLDKEWRRFTIHSTGSASGNVSVSITGSGGTSGSSQNNIADLTNSKHYLTRGQTVSANGQVYLVAYRLPGGGLDFPALIQAMAAKIPPAATALTPETVLPLSLLDVKAIGSLDDIRAFDLKREIAESEKLAQTISAALKSAGGGEKKNADTAGKDRTDK